MMGKYLHGRWGWVRTGIKTAANPVSVNPIDRFTRGAVARSSTGRCYAILLQSDQENPQFGQTYYAKLPPGTPCKADMATPESVRGTEIPL